VKLFKHPLTYAILLLALCLGAIGYAVLRTHLAPPAAQVDVRGAKAKKDTNAAKAGLPNQKAVVSQSALGQGAAHEGTQVRGASAPARPVPAGHGPQPIPQAGVTAVPGTGPMALPQAPLPPTPVTPLAQAGAQSAPPQQPPLAPTAPKDAPSVQGQDPNSPAPGQSVASSTPAQPQEALPAPSKEPLAPAAPGGAVPVGAKTLPPQKPGKISFIVMGLGRQSEVTSLATSLPKEVGLAFHAGQDVTPQQKEAQAKGYETFVMLPMEPLDYPMSDPGPGTLLTGLDASENVRRLGLHLEGRTPCMGVIPFMGSRFLFSTKDLAPVMQMLAQQKLIFVDTGISLQSVAGKIAKDTHTDEIKVGASLGDEIADAGPMAARLEELEALSRKKDHLVVLVQARPMVLQALKDWCQALSQKNISLVSVGSIFSRSNASLVPATAPVPVSLADLPSIQAPQASQGSAPLPTTPTPLGQVSSAPQSAPQQPPVPIKKGVS